jgi:hypothetical protein
MYGIRSLNAYMSVEKMVKKMKFINYVGMWL